MPLAQRIAQMALRVRGVEATTLARPMRKATAEAAPLRFGFARGSLRARLSGRAALPLSAARGSDGRTLWYDACRYH